MQYFTKDFEKFFKGLAKNNHKEWFQEHRKEYEQHVKKPFDVFVNDLIQEVGKIEPEVSGLLSKNAKFRINRDIRFSKDKSPYNLHVSAIVSPKGRKDHSYPGYYIMINAEKLMVGGGAYAPNKEQLYAIRQEVAYNMKEFEKLLKAKKFKDKYGDLKGEKNKVLPKEFKEDAQKQPRLYNKQFYYMADLPLDIVYTDKLMVTVIEHIKSAQDINKFLRRAIFDK